MRQNTTVLAAQATDLIREGEEPTQAVNAVCIAANSSNFDTDMVALQVEANLEREIHPSTDRSAISVNVR